MDKEMIDRIGVHLLWLAGAVICIFAIVNVTSCVMADQKLERQNELYQLQRFGDRLHIGNQP